LGFLPLFPDAFKVNKGSGPVVVIRPRSPSIAASPHRAPYAGNRVKALAGTLLVMAGLDPAIHAFATTTKARRGCPAQGRA
jgi:hypothetical protein